MSSAMEPEAGSRVHEGGLADPNLRRVIQGLAHVAVWGCDPAGKIIFWNRGCERLIGHAATTVLGCDFAEILLTAGDRQRIRAHLTAGEHAVPGTICRILHRDGRPFEALLHQEIVRTHTSSPPQSFVVVTPLRAGVLPPDEQLLHAQKLESLGVLAAGIAHDFNNLLLGVVGNADLVLMELPGDHHLRDAVEQIAQAGLRAADLCRQLLAFSGKGKVLVEKLDLSRLVQDMAPLMHMSLGGMRLCLDLAEDLPAIEGDAAQIRQVVMNLATNAAEAMSEKPGVLVIQTRLHDATRNPLRDEFTGRDLPAGTYVVLTVQDEGPGLTSEQLARVFDPFFTTKFMGRGLGLAAVQGIVRAHHGTVTVDTRPDSGATFSVFLPALGVRAATATAPVDLAQDMVASQSSVAHILVVDDEQHVRDVAGHLLTSAGYEVTRVEDGTEALAILARDPGSIGLVLLDMTMPGLDGLEVLERIRKLRHDLPVLLSSGYGREKVGHVLAADEHCSFIQKPYRRRELLASTKDLLGEPDTD